MPRRRPVLAALALALAAVLAPACASRIQHHTQYSEDVDFGRIQTYAWIRDAGIIDLSPDAAQLKDPARVEGMIREAVDRELANKGLRQVAHDEADVLVMFTLGIRTLEVAIGTNAVEYGLVWHSKESEIHQRGELSLDIFDRASKAHIWHGSAEKRITEDDEPAVLVDRAAVLILSEFPPAPR
ncbi:MAG: DUF4136 domain-containing protein [Myxococcales bacterium]|nr:DUF4136 domain-containing protein [Myxococcales bacterium]